ncbi:hypothetical protein KUA11_17345, partial [Acetobacter estunensis]|nr:hypothetical protein [Acetobacter estunensis]
RQTRRGREVLRRNRVRRTCAHDVTLFEEGVTESARKAWPMRCDCGDQLHTALRRIGEAESGVLLYVRGHEGRGIGLGNKIR